MTRYVLALAVLVAGPAAAQQVTSTGSPSPARAWLGVSYDVRWIQQGDVCQPQVVVERVVQGSPAERAGLRSGDAIVAVDGAANPGARLPLLATRLNPGDSVRLRVARAGSMREIIAVADRRPARPPALTVEPVRGGLLRSTAPLVEIRGDTLIARNLESGSRWVDSGGRGYWIVAGDGRTEFRRVSTWSGDDMDRRVSELLMCADTVRWTAEAPVVARVDLNRLQARADSLRLLMARRALAPDDRGRRTALLRELTERARQPRSGSHEVQVEGPGTFIYRFDEALAGGQRAVAGAEVTALEPELADYFRGVRNGLLVLRVGEGTPADRAGLRPGDVITAGSGRRITAVAELRGLLTLPDATPVELRVVRHGRDRTITIRRD